MLREVLRFTAKLADISAHCAEHFIKYECLDYSVLVVQAAKDICMVGESITRGQGDDILGRGGKYSLHVLVRVKSIMRISVLWQPCPAPPLRPGKSALGTTLALCMQL